MVKQKKPEAIFQSKIIKILEDKEIGWNHIPKVQLANGKWMTVQMGEKGMPDLFIYAPDITIYLEVKVDKEVSDDQINWFRKVAHDPQLDIPKRNVSWSMMIPTKKLMLQVLREKDWDSWQNFYQNL